MEVRFVRFTRRKTARYIFQPSSEMKEQAPVAIQAVPQKAAAPTNREKVRPALPLLLQKVYFIKLSPMVLLKSSGEIPLNPFFPSTT